MLSAEVNETPLYQALLEAAQKKKVSTTWWIGVSHNLRELAKKDFPVKWHATNVDSAFTWADTPQGEGYWSEVNAKLSSWYMQDEPAPSVFSGLPKGHIHIT